MQIHKSDSAVCARLAEHGFKDWREVMEIVACRRSVREGTREERRDWAAILRNVGMEQ